MAPTLGSFHQKRCVLGWVGMTGAGGHGALDDGHVERYPYVAGSLLPDCDAPHCRGCRSAHGIAAATYSDGRAMRTEFAAISDGSGRQSLRGLIGSSAPRFRIMTIIRIHYLKIGPESSLYDYRCCPSNDSGPDRKFYSHASPRLWPSLGRSSTYDGVKISVTSSMKRPTFAS